jgi:hypothetical protein
MFILRLMLLRCGIFDDFLLEEFLDGVAVDGVYGGNGVRGVEFAIGLEEFDVFFGEVAVKRPIADILFGAEALETVRLLFHSVRARFFIGL